MSFACTLCKFPAKFYCKTCSAPYCSEFCQQNDWRHNGHWVRCNDKADLQLERLHRTDLLPLTLVGPLIYYRYKYNGQDYWFFGEEHVRDEKQLAPYKERLDVHIDKEGGRLEFTGSDTSMLDMSRFFYACAAAATRTDRHMDIFLEMSVLTELERVKFGKGERWQYMTKAVKDNPSRIAKTARLFKNMRCLSFDKTAEEQCEVHPFVHAHYIDYRNVRRAAIGFSLETELFDFVGYCYYSLPKGQKITRKILEIFGEFIDELNLVYSKQYRQMYLQSKNFVRDFTLWIKPLTADLRSLKVPSEYEYLLDTFEHMTDVAWMTDLLRTKPKTEASRQIRKLREQNPDIADKLVKFIAAEEPIMHSRSFLTIVRENVDKLLDSNHKYSENDFRLFASFHLRQTAWMMDAPALARILRTPHELKMSYTGMFHTMVYAYFFKVFLQAAGPQVDPQSFKKTGLTLEISDRKDRRFLNEFIYY